MKKVSFKEIGGSVTDFFGVPIPETVEQVSGLLERALLTLGVEHKLVTSSRHMIIVDGDNNDMKFVPIGQASEVVQRMYGAVPLKTSAEEVSLTLRDVLKEAGFRLFAPGRGFHDPKMYYAHHDGTGRWFFHAERILSRAASLVWAYYQGLVSDEQLRRIADHRAS